ncbi:hypothetical protein RSOLAG22IIIB_13495 [Rhizoctonia solani]|uniref:Ricin B lectin domain-containing protein n=1 Tax=Rhizoctonia solani TaxID=456999 RepID=A0A0K6FNS6_9AGAM|nr:hypothetical protein RSOLAG22IIIB_13495 [Rhizoctonia solani]
MPIVPGKYRIKNAMSWTTLDEATDGTHLIHGWQQTNQSNQHWLVQGARDCFTLKNLASGLYASVDGVYNGSKLHGSKDKYCWCLDQDTDGSVFITVPRTNFVVDLDNGNPANGTTIHLWEKSGARQQRWYFEKL